MPAEHLSQANTPPALLRRPSQDEFMENLSTAAVALQGAVPKVLEFIDGKEIDAL